ncbi:hypothetical protein Aperf_G00000032089 [Anoplocephala perfoliata]
MDKCLERAMKAKPKTYLLQLYRDSIKVGGHEEDIQLSKLKKIKQSTDLLTLVLCSDYKDGKRSHLITMKFNNVDGFEKVLYSLKEAMKTEMSDRDKVEVPQDSNSSLMRQSLEKRNLVLNEHVRPPRRKHSVPKGDTKDILNQNTSGRSKEEHNWRERKVGFASSVGQINKNRSKTSFQTEEDYYDSVYYNGDYYNIHRRSESEVDLRGKYRYHPHVGNFQGINITKKHYSVEKTRIVGTEVLRDSFGNTVQILRPREIRPEVFAVNCDFNLFYSSLQK